MEPVQATPRGTITQVQSTLTRWLLTATKVVGAVAGILIAKMVFSPILAVATFIQVPIVYIASIAGAAFLGFVAYHAIHDLVAKTLPSPSQTA